MGIKILATASAGTLFLASQAFGAAWTQPTGNVQIITQYTYSEATEAFDDEGERTQDADFYKNELSVLIEYGALDYLTAYIKPHFQIVDINGMEEGGHAFTDLGLRLRLVNEDTHVFSVQGQVTLPGDIDGTQDVTLASNEFEAEIRALLGHSFTMNSIPAFWDLQGAYRYREGFQPNEYHLDATFGWQPTEGVEVLLQSFNTWAEGAGEDPMTYPYFRQHKIQGSLVFNATEAMSLQLGGFYTWAGQNVIAEEGVIASAWFRF